MSRDLTAGIEKAYSERNDLLVVALTGRTGSGCTTTADFLCKDFHDIHFSPDSSEPIEKRKLEIATDFAKVNWVPFQKITVSTVIFGFLMGEEWHDIESFLKIKKSKPSQIESIKSLHTKLASQEGFHYFFKLMKEGKKDHREKAWLFYRDELTTHIASMKNSCGDLYPSIFQSLGDNVRRSGRAVSDKIDPDQIFALIRSVKRLIKAAFYASQNEGIKSTRIVIDAIRNPLELVYLRDQFAAFYSIAITTNDKDRRQRLSDIGFNKRTIDAIDEKEYSGKALKNYDNFVSQNIENCIQKSDVFFINSGEISQFTETSKKLNEQIVRYVSLMLRPGLITPTKDERCMQIAFVAKLNSGCISRQVGAALVDKNYSVKAVGWNDVPKGQISCLLRDVGKLLGSGDIDAFSDYEKNDKKIRAELGKKFAKRENIKTSSGLHCPFCFKDSYNAINNNQNNQVHTRSLHAEENAFLQLAKYGNSTIEGGILYTTASPCELCSKKAFQLGIKQVVYVDPYPGISSIHVLASGDVKNRPELKLFSGAVGNAYHRLYEPILSIKDEYMARLGDDPQPELI